MQAIGAIGLASQVAGPLVGAAGNAMSADVNAKGLQAQARSIDEQTAFDERQFRRTADVQAGTNVARAAATGLDISKGSPLFAELDLARQHEIEAQSIKRGGKIAADNKRFDARMTRRQIPFDLIGGALGATSALAKLGGK